MIQIKIDDNEIKNKINQIKNNKKLIINKIASILEQDPYGNKRVYLKSKNLLIKINFLSFPYTLQCQ